MIPIAALGGIIGPRAAELVGKVLPYIIGAALVALAFTLGRCDGVSDERARNTLALERSNAAALRIKAAADTIAAAQRLKDAQRLSQASKDRTDAIDKAPDSKTAALCSKCTKVMTWVSQTATNAQNIDAIRRKNPILPFPCPVDCALGATSPFGSGVMTAFRALISKI